MSNFFTKVSYPVLTDLKLDTGGVKTDLIYPRGIPDVFRGSQVTLIGRYSNEADLESVKLTLTGKSAGTTRTYSYPAQRFPLRSDANEFLPRLWATRRVGWLMEQVRTNGEQKELRDEIVDLGTRYGIVTPYTSYLALEGEMSKNITELRRSNRPQSQGRASMQPGFSSAPQAVTGADAVMLSKESRGQQQAESLKDEKASSILKRVGEKSFYLLNGIWTDSQFTSDAKLPEKSLRFGSDEYFALLKEKPQLARYFSLGERVVVVLDGVVYRVDSN